MAAGEVDVDRPVERDARLAPCARSSSAWPLVSDGGEPAAGRCRCRRRGRRGSRSPWWRGRAPRSRPRPARPCRPATPEISRFCQTVRRISPSPRSLRDLGEAAHLRGGQLADRQHDADPVQPGLLLRMHADMRRAVERRPRRDRLGRHARRACGRASPRPAARNFSKPQASSTYFSRALLRLVRSPCSMKTRTMASATLRRIGRLDDHAGVAREIPVAGDAAEREAEPDAGLDAEAVLHLDRLEADVVGVLQHRRCMPAPSKATLNLRGRP